MIAFTLANQPWGLLFLQRAPFYFVSLRPKPRLLQPGLLQPIPQTVDTNHFLG